MPTIQRPLKTYGTRSYVAEVAAAPGNYDPVLANEVDDDLDTVYTAWNNTLAQGILWSISGATLTPTDPTKIVSLTTATPQILLGGGTQKGAFTVNTTGLFSMEVNSPYAPQDMTKASWMFQLETATDAIHFYHRLANGAAGVTELLKLDGAGNMTLSGPNLVVAPTATGPVFITARGAGSYGIIAVHGSLGTAAAPTPLPQWSQLGNVQAQGCYQAGLFSQQAQLQFYAAENWTATARGTGAFLYVTPVGTTNAQGNSFGFGADGNFTITGPTGQKSTGTTWANPSDRRLKDDITDYTTGLAAILGLAPRTFLYNGKGGSQAGLRGYGYLADEVEHVMPEMLGVTKAKLNADDEDDTDIQTLDTSNITLALVNAVKELAARVTALEGR